jgi:hypothetical protein
MGTKRKTNQKKMILRPYQKEWYKALILNRNNLIVGPRQVGKDFVLQTWAPYEAHRVYDISPSAGLLCLNKDQRISSNYLKGTAHFARVCSKAGIFNFDPTSGRSGSVTELRWIVNEDRPFVKALPSQPSSVQGFTGSIIWNEVGANRNDPEEIWSQVVSASSAFDGLKLALVSNATARGSWLDHLLHDDDPQWVKKRQTFGSAITVASIYDIYPQGLPKRLEEIKASMTSAAWARWYECRFVDGGTGPLAEYMRNHAQDVQVGNPVGRPILCIDPGVTMDPTGVIAIQPHERGFAIVHHELWYQKPIPEQVDEIMSLYQTLRPRLLICDQGTQGYAIYNSLLQRLGKDIVVSGNAGDASYHRQLQRLEDLTRSKTLHVPEEHSRVGDHLGEVLRDEHDKVWIPYVPDGHRKRHHCDLAVAVMMASDHLPVTYTATTGQGRKRTSWNDKAPSGFNPF